MRKSSDVWFDANPFDEDAAYTGPGKYTIRSTYKKTRKASYVHDGTYEDEKNPYIIYNKADAYWGRDVDDKDPIGFFGKTIWDLKRFGSSVYEGLFDSHEPTNNTSIDVDMPSSSYKRPRAVYSRRAGKAARRVRRDTRRRGAGPMTWSHMRQCVEKKFWDQTRAVAVIGNSGGAAIQSPLALVAQGTTAETRIGQKMFVWDIQLKGQITMLANTNADSVVTRVMLVKDKQSNGATPNLGDILDLGATNDVYAFRKTENLKRFTVLGDKLITINRRAGDGVAQNAEVVIPFRFYKKFTAGLKVMYKTNNSDGANLGIMDNNVWLLMFSDSSNATVGEWESRIRFTD